MKKQSPIKKRGAHLGQHFLANKKVAEAVVDAAEVQKGDTVLEVGPGKGVLTEFLLKRGAHVVAIEKDSSLVAFLKERFAEEIQNKKLTLIEGDVRTALQESVPKGEYKVAANIPYYITGELVRAFLSMKHQPTTLAFLVQKEVAERIARSKKESILSLSVKVYGVPRYVKTVRKGNFNPPPSVDSAILSIHDISRKNFTQISEEMFFKVVKAGFSQKRKKLAGNLKRVSSHALSVLQELGLEHVRAEDVSLEGWLHIAKKL